MKAETENKIKNYLFVIGLIALTVIFTIDALDIKRDMFGTSNRNSNNNEDITPELRNHCLAHGLYYDESNEDKGSVKCIALAKEFIRNDVDSDCKTKAPKNYNGLVDLLAKLQIAVFLGQIDLDDSAKAGAGYITAHQLVSQCRVNSDRLLSDVMKRVDALEIEFSLK